MPQYDVASSEGRANAECDAKSDSDPLMRAIKAYRAGLADFRDNAPDDDDEASAYADRTYCPPMIQLEQWSSPAITKEAALAALALAREAHSEGDRSLVAPMISAALVYFERGE